MAANNNPGALAGATGADAFSSAASASKVQNKGKKRQRGILYEIKPDEGPRAFRLRLDGREAWTLEQLAEAGPLGLAPIERPAPRWSQYVLGLRRGGVPIETVREKHGGAFPGHHGRYILRASVRRVAAS